MRSFVVFVVYSHCAAATNDVLVIEIVKTLKNCDVKKEKKMICAR
jgi:hypothetical protein